MEEIIEDFKCLLRVYEKLKDVSEYYKGRYYAFLDIIARLEKEKK